VRKTIMRILVGLWLGLFIITPAWAAGTATPASQGFAAVSPSKALPRRGKTPRELANRSSKTRSDLKKGAQAELSGDYATAVSIFKPLAEHGDAAAQDILGWMYYNGHGVLQDYAKALYWVRKAAVQGVADAQYSLGLMYDNGHGVPQDYAKALYWYRKAAAQGVAKAQFLLGTMYSGRYGVPRDDAKAAYWYRKAAGQGVAKAQLLLGAMYRGGYGVPQDYVEAAKWGILAKAGGAEQANKLLSLLEPEMTRAQIAEAQRLANQWWEAHHKQ
jgi:TPR repeat protein